jgi:hypothetical protein
MLELRYRLHRWSDRYVVVDLVGLGLIAFVAAALPEVLQEERKHHENISQP